MLRGLFAFIDNTDRRFHFYRPIPLHFFNFLQHFLSPLII